MAGVARASSIGWLRDAASATICAPFGDALKIACPSFNWANRSTVANGNCSAARTAWLALNLKLFAFR